MSRFFRAPLAYVVVLGFLFYLLISGKIPAYIGFAKK